MSSDWRTCLLGDVVNLKRGFDLPARDRRQGRIPLISSAGASDFHDEAKVKGPGVVTGRYGTIGNVYFSGGDFWPLNTSLFVEDFKGNDPRFIYFLLKTIDYFKYSDKGAVPGVNRNHLHTAEIVIPDLPEQNEIALFLGCIEDRISLLRETNTTLEAIAQALFKSWFVDFDPVRAKLQGRGPEGMDAVTAALFPDRFEESDRGLVPRGWCVSTLGSICAENVGAIQTGPFGSQLHASDYLDAGIPVVMPQDLAGRRVQIEKIARVGEADANRLSRHRLRLNDIVFSRRGDVGRHALIGSRETGWLCGTGCLLVRPGETWPSGIYLSLALDRADAKEWLLRHAVGATMPNLNTGILSAVPIMHPDIHVLRAFDNVVRVLDDGISNNHSKIRSLSELRDTLLPRLISGQLRLPDAEALVKEAA